MVRAAPLFAATLLETSRLAPFGGGAETGGGGLVAGHGFSGWGCGGRIDEVRSEELTDCCLRDWGDAEIFPPLCES